MGWENRNGRRYYYRKRRDGRQVISEYIGSGEWVEFMAERDKIESFNRLQERLEERQELERWLQLDREINQALETCSEMLNAALILAGYHTHKGTWRRSNGKR